MPFYGEKHHSWKFRVSIEFVDFDIAVVELPDTLAYYVAIDWREK
jgi:hypothetical protein